MSHEPPRPASKAGRSRPQLRLERRLAVQYVISRAFAEAETIDDVAGLVVQALVDVLGWESSSLWVMGTDGAGLRCVAIHPTHGRLREWADGTRALRLEMGRGLPGRVWAAGRSIWIRDTDDDEQFVRRPLARKVGLRHGFAFPVWLRDEIVAVVELFAADARDVDPEHAAFLDAVGHQLGSLIERIESRRAMANSEAHKTAILHAAVDAIVSADGRGRITEFNPAAEALFGRRRDEVVGRRIADLLVPDDLRGQHERGLARYVGGGKSRILGRRVRTWAARADGTRFPVELTVTEMRVAEDRMFTAFIRDVTRERQAEIARDRFLEILSHELRTPVTAIYGGSKVAARPTVPAAEREELLADIGSEADRLYRLVEDLMVLARAERRADTIELEPVSLDRVVERVAAAVHARWRDLEFRLRSSGGGNAVQADETYLEQVVRNLLTNAAKYGYAGGIVEIEIEHGEAESTLRVLDRGPGVDTAEVDRLFEIDYRSPATEGLAHGSGIGLFVARWLVERMGGRIWARSRPGGGSEFGVALATIGERDPEATDPLPLEASPALEVVELAPEPNGGH